METPSRGSRTRSNVLILAAAIVAGLLAWGVIIGLSIIVAIVIVWGPTETTGTGTVADGEREAQAFRQQAADATSAYWNGLLAADRLPPVCTPALMRGVASGIDRLPSQNVDPDLLAFGRSRSDLYRQYAQATESGDFFTVLVLMTRFSEFDQELARIKPLIVERYGIRFGSD